MGRVSCIVVGQRRPGNSLLGILQLGSRGRREQGTASLSQVGQGEEEATCIWGKAGIQDSASGILVLRGIKEKESLGMDQRKAAGWEDTCELFRSPPWGSPDIVTWQWQSN